MATIIVDGRSYEVSDGTNLLHACLSLGLNLPFFCWHPAMGSVGACRQCAVKQFRDAQDTRGRIVMACMTPATDGTRIAVEDPEARAFRASVIEWLMLSHPHDCPVCDEGSECHLQDMTVMTGHVYRRYGGTKRTWRNQDLGPFLTHEMNRCIQCYRCVRFYRDYAGGRDFDAHGIRDHVYFGRKEDGPLESPFSGNLVEVCPTGVFDDRTLAQRYTRKWDLQTAPSICIHCGLGCNTIPGERYGELRRIRNRYNGAVNRYFLCDRGRYGYEFVNSERRIRWPLARREERLEPVGKEEALRRAAALVADGRAIGIGSPRASLEANFALRTLVGPERFYLGVSDAEHRLLATVLAALRAGPARAPSLHDVEQCDAVLVLGEDVTNTAPRLALALRQSVRRRPMQMVQRMGIPEWNDAAARELIQDQNGPLFIATPYPTDLDDLAVQTDRAAPDDLARLGFAVAHALDGAAPFVSDLSEEQRDLAGAVAGALQEAERPLVVAGVSLGSEALVQAAANVAWALCRGGRHAALCYVVPDCNSLGLALMGGGSLSEARAAVQGGGAETVIVLEDDLYRRADAETATAILEGARHVIAVDYLTSPTTAQAEVVLPAGTFAESDGTLVNNEGRAQRFYQVFVPGGDVQESWRWLRDLMATAGLGEHAPWQSLDDVVAAMAAALPAFRVVPEVAPPAGFRIAGQRIARQHARFSGRTAIVAHLTVHEPQPPDDPDTPLAFSMEGFQGQPPAPLIPRFWAPGWNSDQALHRFQEEVDGPLRGGDPGRRLIEPDPGAQAPYFGRVPAPFRPRPAEWLVVPVFHIFGSEPLSMLSPGIAERAPRPYLGLSAVDAERLGVRQDADATVQLQGAGYTLPVRLMPGLPVGVAGLPVGLPGLEGISLPAWGRIAPRRPGKGGGEAP